MIDYIEKMMIYTAIHDYLTRSISVKTKLAETCASIIEDIVETIVVSYRTGGKVIVFGNGGSAADAQHMAAELVGRFKMERCPLPALALACNTSSVTAIANDYAYDQVFVRQLEAFVAPGDSVIGISTSGQSQNVMNAMALAQKMGAKTIAFTGYPGLPLADTADYALVVPDAYTPMIQEAHITVIHIICKCVEEILCKETT